MPEQMTEEELKKYLPEYYHWAAPHLDKVETWACINDLLRRFAAANKRIAELEANQTHIIMQAEDNHISYEADLTAARQQIAELEAQIRNAWVHATDALIICKQKLLPTLEALKGGEDASM